MNQEFSLRRIKIESASPDAFNKFRDEASNPGQEQARIEYFEKKTKLRIKQLKQMFNDVKKAKKLSSPAVKSSDPPHPNADLD